MVNYLDYIFTGLDTVWLIMIIAILLLLVTLLIWVIMVVVPYKHFIRVRELTGGKTRIIDDKAREIKDKTGVSKWKLLKRRHLIPVPPSEAIHLTKKGKYSVEAYYTPEGEYKYVIDEGLNDVELSNFKPLNTQDREFYANEMMKAELYKKKSVLEYIREFAPLIALMLIFILMLVFWQDIAAPSIQLQANNAEISAQNAEATRMLRDIIQNRQTIEDKKTET